ncbi:bifunctional lytic transglycosylase/C40 family peptidase [Nocardiopsis rhodophaea]
MALIAFTMSLVSVKTDEDWTTTSAGANIRDGTVPEEYVEWIEKAAASCDTPGLTAPILAAQLWQESKFDPNIYGPPVRVSVNGVYGTYRAEGIAQFMSYTWPEWKIDANNNGKASPFDPPDAIMAQGKFMCSLLKQAKSSGIPGDPIELALAGYNAGFGAVQAANGIPRNGQTEYYVPKIMEKAQEFTDPNSDGGLIAGVNGDVAGAVQWAVAQQGTWYVYGGECKNPQKTTQGSPFHWTGQDYYNNCDCSSLMQQAYAKIGVNLPRTTFDQINVGKAVSPSDVKPGDLLFPHSGHVGMYIGNNKVVHAPYTGTVVKIADYNPGYWGAYGVRRVV